MGISNTRQACSNSNVHLFGGFEALVPELDEAWAIIALATWTPFSLLPVRLLSPKHTELEAGPPANTIGQHHVSSHHIR
jgi:hypothetical protein